MKKNNIASTIAVIMLNLCLTHTSTAATTADSGGAPVVLSVDADSISLIMLSDITESIRMYPLHFSNESQSGQVHSAAIAGGKIMLSFGKLPGSVFFDTNGNLLLENDNERCSIDVISGDICAYNEKEGKAYTINAKGDVTGTDNVSHVSQPLHIFKLQDGFFYHLSHGSVNQKGGLPKRRNSMIPHSKKTPLIEYELTSTPVSGLESDNVSYLRDGYTFHIIGDSVIYSIPVNGDGMRPEYIIRFKEKTYPAGEVRDVYETDRHLVFSYSYGNNGYSAIFDKKGELMNGSVINDLFDGGDVELVGSAGDSFLYLIRDPENTSLSEIGLSLLSANDVRRLGEVEKSSGCILFSVRFKSLSDLYGTDATVIRERKRNILAASDTLSAEKALMRFAGNVHQFGHIFPQEKVFIQFDNTSYYTGETIWFKAFVVTASDHHRAQSGVLYVDLVSPNGVILKQEKLKIVAGQADGSFPLVDGATAAARERRKTVLPYPSGFYEVRAYTSHMLNFGDDVVFSRVLPVFEKPEQDGNYYGERPLIKEKKSTIEQYRPNPDNLKTLNAEFFPEGGSMIIGQPCRVAFKLMGDSGFGVSADGTLNNTIPLHTIHDGMGSFEFIPSRADNRATFTYNDKIYSFNLPKAQSSGYVMRADVGKDTIEVILRKTADIVSDTLGVTLTCRGELMYFSTVLLTGASTKIHITKEGLPQGVCQLTLFDRRGNVYATRHLFSCIEHNQPVPELTFTTDKELYGPFEKIKLSMSLTNGKNHAPFRDRFCLSVRDSKCLGMALENDFRTTLLLSSDIKGMVYNPEYYFEADDEEHRKALDLLMLVQGWERYDWQTMATVKPYKEVHRMEYGLGLNGWIETSLTRKPIDSVLVLAAVMPWEHKSQTEQFRYVTGPDGYFGFNISDFNVTSRLTIFAKDDRMLKIGNYARIRLERSMYPLVRRYRPEELVITGKESKRISRKTGIKEEITEIENTDTTSYPKIIYEDLGYILPEVEIKDKRIYIDYFTFKTHDVKKDTEHERDKGDFTTDLHGYFEEKGYMMEQYPNIEYFYYVHDSQGLVDAAQGRYDSPLSIDVMDIVSINVFDRPMYKRDAIALCPMYQEYMTHHASYLIGEELWQRVRLIEVVLKDEHERSTRKERMNISRRSTTLLGFSAPYEFYSPEYPKGPARGDVDYRRTLYWNPNVITDAEGHAEVEFYNNSYSTHFNVCGAGITAEGTPYVLDEGF